MTKTAPKFYQELVKKFPFEPTILQNELLVELSDFFFEDKKDTLFLLKGYAGTGKTTTISTVVNNLWRIGVKAVLLAPTGRAAKVISGYSGRNAFTIHKKIYFPKKNKGGGVDFTLQPNKHTNTVFIIDEASMIPDSPSSAKLFESGSLLDDVMSYIYSGVKCKAIFIGDTAQLPPVKLDVSPALDATKLALNYNKEVIEFELNEVMRQHENSGILINATQLRQSIGAHGFDTFKFEMGFDDVVRLIDGYEIQDAIQSAYDSEEGIENTAFIVRSNKRANQYNQQIRGKILGLENEIATGDFIMVVKNNYFWLNESSEAGFIANGDICEILEIFNIKELYGFKFAEVKIRMVDYPNQKPFETVLLLDTLTSETPSLSYEESNRLYQEVGKDFANESKYKQLLAIKKNKYFNALQVKFSYAVTCHKSQGGQWDRVFIEQPYLPDGQSVEYLRWLYTALTRAQEKVFLIGFKDDYFF